MAIIVKGKIRICQTSLADWTPERVNGIWFYDRYQEFAKLFSAKISDVDFEKCFAQPVFNDETNTIEWFCSSPASDLVALSDAADTAAETEKNRITTAIQNAAKRLSENDRKYLTPILLTLQSDKVDAITYHNDGQVVFGIWGMSMKKGKVMQDVIIDDIKDHRTHHVKYKVQGKGSLNFSEIVRRHGHILGGETDIPNITPHEGYYTKEWIPESPFGQKVDRDLLFTAVIQKDPNYVGPQPPLNVEEKEKDTDIVEDTGPKSDVLPPPSPDPEPEPNFYNVHFVSDERGTLQGQTEYLKQENDKVLASEVPAVQPREGFRFIGWDMPPINHIVKEDVTFTAQYEPIEEEKIEEDRLGLGIFGGLPGCLSWLLSLLLLGLIGLLLWFLLGNHNLNFCGCDCNNTQQIIPTPQPSPSPTPEPDPDPTPKPCDRLQREGSNQPESFIFEMGKKGGTFQFEYATGGRYADRIVIYDGDNRNNPIIFDIHKITGGGGWDDREIELLDFKKSTIMVDIIPDPSPETYWEIKVNCP